MSRALQFAKKGNESPEEPLFVSVVDMFGYETKKINSFEQLCTNYVSERMQNQVIKSFFQSDFDMYQKEEIRMTDFKFTKNQDVVDVLDKKPMGILCMVSCEPRANRAASEPSRERTEPRANRAASEASQQHHTLELWD